MKVGVIGKGFVGGALAQGFCLAVSRVLVYDSDPSLSTDTLDEVCSESDVIFVCVPTPMKKSGEIDLKIINNVMEEIGKRSKDPEQIVVVKSTVVPGTMETLQSKHKNLALAFNPEFLTERTARLDFINASRIVIGSDHSWISDKLETLYRLKFRSVPIIKTDFATSQLIKYMSNCFFATKVSFMNEMKQVCDAASADWEMCVDGFILDGRIGNSHIDVPGHDGSLGFGGKCFPKDINAMIERSKELGVKPTVLSAVWEKNLEVRQNHDWLSITGAVSEE